MECTPVYTPSSFTSYQLMVTCLSFTSPPTPAASHYLEANTTSPMTSSVNISICISEIQELLLILFFKLKLTLVYNTSHMYIIISLLLFPPQHTHHQKLRFHPLPFPPPPLVTTTLFSISTCLFLFGLSIIFVDMFLIFYIGVKSYSICLSHLTYFTQQYTFAVYPCCQKWQEAILFMAE